MAFYAGKGGSITIGAATFKLSEWSLDIDADILDITNFSSSGQRENIEGLESATITAKGPYDAGSMGVTVGSSVAFVLTVGGAVSFTVTARVSKVRVNVPVEDKVGVEITASSNGTFTAAIT